MIELVNRNDSRAVRNKDIVLRLYELMGNAAESSGASL
jgi:hypothetical protein